MAIKISTNDLQQIVNPLSPNFIEGFILNESEINKYVEELNFLSTENDLIDQKIAKKIAFLTFNPSKEPIVFETINNETVCVMGKENYIAQILQKNSSINVVMKSLPIEIQTFLKLNKEDLQPDFVPKKEIELILNWNINPDTLRQTWLNVDYVINKLKEWKSEHNINTTNMNLIPLELWQNSEFQDKCLEVLAGTQIHHLFPKFVLAEPRIQQKIKNNMENFGFLWENTFFNTYKREMLWNDYLIKCKERKALYIITNKEMVETIIGYKNRNLLEMLIELLKNEIEKNTNELKNDIIVKELYELSLVYHEQAINALATIDIKEEKLTNSFIDFVKELLQDKAFIVKNPQLGPKLYPYLTHEIRADIEVILTVFSEGTTVYYQNPQEIIPDIVLNNMENLIKIWNHVKEKNIYVISDFGRRTAEVLLEKPKLLLFLNSTTKETQQLVLTKIWENKEFIKKYKKDKEIILRILPIFVDIYKNITTKLKEDKDIIEVCINNGGIDFLREELIYQLTNRDLIKKAVSIKEGLLTNEDCPLSWKKDIELLVGKNNLEYLGYSSQEWEDITQGNKELYLKLLKGSSAIYISFKDEIKNDLEIALLFLNKNEYNVEEIPKKVWAKREFCLEALMVNPNFSKYVPEVFWKEKEFILNFCQILDVTDYPKDYLNQAPKDIQKFFEAFDVNKNYNQFLLTYTLELELNQNNTATKIKKNKI